MSSHKEERPESFDDERSESFDDELRRKEARRDIDLATTLECIEKNFVSHPRLSDNPIIFASDSFLQLTEYSHEEILGRNCSVTVTMACIETSIPRKHGPAIAGYEAALKKFFEHVLQAFLKHIDFYVVQCVVIVSPGFTKQGTGTGSSHVGSQLDDGVVDGNADVNDRDNNSGDIDGDNNHAAIL